jgi:hypothetical protein
LISTLSYTGEITKITQNWTSNNVEIASVKNGLITALSKGTTVITVKADDKTATCQVTVDDQITPSLTKGILVYYGDAYNTTTDSVVNNETNNFILYLGDTNVDMNDYFNGDGERLILEFNTPLSAKDTLPAGTYDMMTELSKSKILPFTLIPAYYDSNNNEWGCWYFNVISGIGKSFCEASVGNVVVSYNQNAYTIKYYLIDYYGNTISGTYHGAVTFFDGSSSSAPDEKMNSLKTIQRKLKSESHKLFRR